MNQTIRKSRWWLVRRVCNRPLFGAVLAVKVPQARSGFGQKATVEMS